MDRTTIRLVAVPFNNGFDWRWRDSDGNEYDIEHEGDMEVDLTGHRINTMGTKKNKLLYTARVSMTVPFEQDVKSG